MADSVVHVPPDGSTPIITARRVIAFSLATAGIALFLLIWPESLTNISSSNFLPQSYCYLQQSRLISLHVISDTLIGLACFAIAAMLGLLIYRRRDTPYAWIFIATGVFASISGAAHLIQVFTVWTPVYWLSADVKLVTAIASVAAAVVMPPLLPRTVRVVKEAVISEERRRRLEQAHKELETLYVRFKEYDQQKSRFFASVSHDLRTPLTLILGPAEKLLRSHGLTQSERKGLETIQHNARLLLVHVNDLLDISRLEAGKLEPNYQAIDLAETVRFSASFFETLATEKKIDYNLNILDSVLAEVDTEKIQRIVLNLLSNAFKFTPTKGKVRVTVGERDLTGFLEVADSGPGIPADLREAIFEPYRQLRTDPKQVSGGTGLGLAIVKDFVTLHRGKIAVSNAPEGGALFRIEIPLRAPKNARFARVDTTISQAEVASAVVEESRPETLDEPTPQADPDPSKATVLVIEDNSEMRAFISAVLEREYRVITARNGREGLDKAQAESPDLILSDIMMPVMTGDGLVEELQRSTELSTIPLILISARADERTRINLLRKGVQDYLVKPFSPDELLARVGNLITNKRVSDLLRRELAGSSSNAEQLAQEITARNRQLQSAVDELRVSETRFRKLSESGVVGIIRADAHGSIIDANDAFLTMLGYTRQDMNNGQIVWDEITPPEWDEADRHAAEQLTRTGRIVPFEKEYVGKDGRHVPVLIGAALVNSGSHEAIVLVLDLTERKRAELALRNSEKLATIGRLAGTVAHEINNPLDAVSNLLFLIHNDPELSPSSREYSRLASEEVSRVGQICRQMLGFYRESTTPVSVDVTSVLESVMSLYKRKVQTQNIRVETRFRYPGAVLGFPGEMRQLFSNLFVNALEATGANGRVALRTQVARDWQYPARVGVRIWIHDTGSGIDPRVMANLFEPFFTTKGEKGTGLGLWVSRGIVEKHGGFVRVRTSTRSGSSGTSFMIFLPIDASAVTSHHEAMRMPA
jgi:PAS domain S-box-containing protein